MLYFRNIKLKKMYVKKEVEARKILRKLIRSPN